MGEYFVDGWWYLGIVVWEVVDGGGGWGNRKVWGVFMEWIMFGVG